MAGGAGGGRRVAGAHAHGHGLWGSRTAPRGAPAGCAVVVAGAVRICCMAPGRLLAAAVWGGGARGGSSAGGAARHGGLPAATAAGPRARLRGTAGRAGHGGRRPSGGRLHGPRDRWHPRRAPRPRPGPGWPLLEAHRGLRGTGPAEGRRPACAGVRAWVRGGAARGVHAEAWAASGPRCAAGGRGRQAPRGRGAALPGARGPQGGALAGRRGARAVGKGGRPRPGRRCPPRRLGAG
mmetsp:Transcript_113203/g.365773  ORF Transcript_113203/g.365773 Transcript_113203/m.365773 type:complete len:237 (-) Transcript_113203:891-1601(-)